MNKMWKSDGEEQKQLEKMFREKEVNCTMKPSAVQQKSQLFHGFTPYVFRKHWNATKLMFATNIPGTSCLQNNGANDDIIEIDGTAPPPAKSAKLSLFDDASVANVSFLQPPVVVALYTDPDTKQEICLVIISFLSKIKRIDFDVVSAGSNHVLKVTYSWPLYSYSSAEMFLREGSDHTFVNKIHPKYLAVEKALESFRENFEDAPQGVIEVNLPANIQLDPGTWKHYLNKKQDGMLLLFYEFLCVRKDYIIKKNGKTIILE